MLLLAIKSTSVPFNSWLTSRVCINYQCWLQGYNATPQNIELVIAAFRDGLQQQGFVKN